jgi:hypothetical protein
MQCQHCGFSIPAEMAQAAAEEQAKIKRVCHEARTVKILAGLYAVSLFLQLVPILGFNGVLANRVLLFMIPLLLVRTWRRAAALKSADTELVRAKRSLKIALAIWTGCFTLWLGLIAISQSFPPR